MAKTEDLHVTVHIELDPESKELLDRITALQTPPLRKILAEPKAASGGYVSDWDPKTQLGIYDNGYVISKSQARRLNIQQVTEMLDKDEV